MLCYFYKFLLKLLFKNHNYSLQSTFISYFSYIFRTVNFGFTPFFWSTAPNKALLDSTVALIV